MRVSRLYILFFAVSAAAFAQNREGEIYQRDWLTPDSLFKTVPEFWPLPGAYQPAESALQLLRCYDEPVSVLIFFGSWCSDSKREVPHFFTTLNLVNNNNFSAHLFGLDRTKKDAHEFAESFKIDKVPTFIFLRGTRAWAANGPAVTEQTQGELGRITEAPAISLEQDWVNILKQNAGWAKKIESEQQIVLLGLAVSLLSIR